MAGAAAELEPGVGLGGSPAAEPGGLQLSWSWEWGGESSPAAEPAGLQLSWSREWGGESSPVAEPGGLQLQCSQAGSSVMEAHRFIPNDRSQVKMKSPDSCHPHFSLRRERTGVGVKEEAWSVCVCVIFPFPLVLSCSVKCLLG